MHKNAPFAYHAGVDFVEAGDLVLVNVDRVLGNDITSPVAIREFEKIIGHPVNYVISDRRPGDPASLLASNDKAMKLLGWTPKRSNINNIITDAWNWEKNRKF